MDATAIQVVNDDILRNEYHIKARGDLYALREFCEERKDKKKKWNYDNKKKELIHMLLKGRKEKKTSGKEKSQNKVKEPTCTSDTDITKKTRKISLGWLNYDEKIKKYKHVRDSGRWNKANFSSLYLYKRRRPTGSHQCVFI